eukprot:993925-Pelagomonas_calceolata.AAC.4
MAKDLKLRVHEHRYTPKSSDGHRHTPRSIDEHRRNFMSSECNNSSMGTMSKSGAACHVLMPALAHRAVLLPFRLLSSPRHATAASRQKRARILHSNNPQEP